MLNTDQYSKDVPGKLNVVFVVRVTKMFGNVGNRQKYKVWWNEFVTCIISAKRDNLECIINWTKLYLL